MSLTQALFLLSIVWPVFWVLFYVLGVNVILVRSSKIIRKNQKNISNDTDERIKRAVNRLYYPKMLILIYDRFMHPIRKLQMKLFGIDYYQFDRSGSKVYNDDIKRMFLRYEQLINEATHVSMVLGEAGHKLLENKKLMKSLNKAISENEAEVEIIHGPRVDPKTKTIYEMAKNNLLKVYRMEEYRNNHFTLITDKTGELTVIDEGIHDETQWNPDTGKPIIENIVRIIYVYKARGKKARFLRMIQEERKKDAKLIKENPRINPPQMLDSEKITRSFFRTNFEKHILQPLSVMLRLSQKKLFD